MSRSDRIVFAAGGGALVLALAAAFVLFVPPEGSTPGPGDGTALVPRTPDLTDPAAPPSDGETIVVDVEGAVARPGIRELPAGSRIADAIDAAGGYASDADLSAASTINLAQPLTDGQQVRVPRVGEGAVAAAPPAGAADDGASALVNLNTATPEELEALPGIGAVTVQKIVAARQERPFASLQDAVDRGVINRGQLEDISGVATAG
jgi:competence protein ComEA